MIVINLGLRGGRIAGIFNGNFYTKRGGGFLTFKTGIPGGLRLVYVCACFVFVFTNTRTSHKQTAYLCDIFSICVS